MTTLFTRQTEEKISHKHHAKERKQEWMFATWKIANSEKDHGN